jgi:pimeloyl-ACP methyl ester carboxylesterase
MRRAWTLTVAAAVAVGAAAVGYVVLRGDDEPPARGTLPLEDCTIGENVEARCGRLLVPEDRSVRGGRRIPLRIAVIPATRQPSAGALFYLEGGPGGAATESANHVNNTFGPVARDRDLVLVDQRGTGGSSPLSCPQRHVVVDDVAAMTQYVRRCFARLGNRARTYTTAVAADDLDAVRGALGYRRIDLYGGSYGATLAQVYLHRHPRSVRTVVLDSASLLNVPVNELSAANGERALRTILARCSAEARCRSAFPRVGAELEAILERPPSRRLDGDRIASTIRALSRSPAGAALIPMLVHQAYLGRYTQLRQEFADQVGTELDERSRLATFFTIECSEPWARFDPAPTARLSRGSYLAHVTLARARLFRSLCRFVPKGVVPPGSGTPPRTRAPVLLLAGSADPQDPPASVRDWRRYFRNGRLVVVPGGGHGAVDDGCLNLVAARFVERGTGRGLDTRCVRASSLPPFETP